MEHEYKKIKLKHSDGNTDDVAITWATIGSNTRFTINYGYTKDMIWVKEFTKEFDKKFSEYLKEIGSIAV